MTLLADLKKLASDGDHDKLMGRMFMEYPQIRRALAIAQKVQQHADGGSLYAQAIINEANESMERN